MSYTVAEVKHGSFGSSYICSTDCHEEIRPASHPGLEILYDLHSPLSMTLRRKRLLVHSRHFLLYNAREDHTEIHERSSIKLRTLVVEEDFINGLLSDLDLNFNEIIFDQTQWSPSPFVLGQLNMLNRIRHTNFFLPALEELIFSQLMFEVLTTQPHSHSEKLQLAIGPGQFPNAIAKAQKVMLEQVNENRLSLSDLAAEVGMSKFHFLRAFKQRMGMTPIQYLNRIRLEMAKTELQASHTTVTDVAFGLGFENLSTFYALFKREAAGEPRQFKTTIAPTARIETNTYRYLTVPVSVG